MNGVVVGVDESTTAQDALRWAHAYGGLRQQPVTALMAWDYIGQRHADGTPFDPKYSPEVADQELGKLVERALGPDSGVVRVATLDKPEAALQEASTTADLVVVGARGLGGFRGLLLGSVSRSVLHHAECPVAVVRGEATDLAGPIVVGINGSEHAERALQWAAAFAAESGRRLIVVWAWQVPIVGGPFYPIALDYEGVAQEAASGLHHAVEAAQITGVDVDERPLEGQPAAQILSTAENEGASLLVVGARGATNLTARLLGSVSDQVVQHATVPVVVVP
ncbi:MAG TPA: universal stress protein [Ilumatobacter sp.]|nr:universal stress protein [Ilumatobacter sp.]